jgi:hypothetical protein
MQGYLGITAHFFDENWKLQHIVLDVHYLPYPHTGETIQELLMAIIDEYGIGTKFLAISTDNASTMVKAIDLLKVEMHQKYNHVIYHIHCAAHILNLAIQDGMKVMFDNPDDDDEEVNHVNPINKL